MTNEEPAPQRAEDPDPADVDLMPVLWERAMHSVPFALGLVCWFVALTGSVAGRVFSVGPGPVWILLAVPAPVLWAIDGGRRRQLFAGLPRAWDDPSDVVRVDWWAPRSSPFGRRGFVGTEGGRLRVAWGVVHGWDLLVVGAALAAMGFAAPILILQAGIYVIASAAILGLPRRRRITVDFDVAEITEVTVTGTVFRLRTTREGRDAELTFATWKSDGPRMRELLVRAVGDRVIDVPVR